MTTLYSQIWDPSVIHVNLIGGPAGSGKSTLAGELVRMTGFAPVDKDIANPLSEALLVQMGRTADDRQSEDYLTKVRPLEYKFVKAAILHNISLGNSVVADAPFGKEFGDAQWRAEFEQECIKKAPAGRPVAIHCIAVHTDGDVLKQRLIARNEPRDHDKLNDWENWLAGAQAFKPLEPCLIIDCSKDGEGETTARAQEIIEAFHLLPPVFQRPLSRRFLEHRA